MAAVSIAIITLTDKVMLLLTHSGLTPQAVKIKSTGLIISCIIAVAGLFSVLLKVYADKSYGYPYRLLF